MARQDCSDGRSLQGQLARMDVFQTEICPQLKVSGIPDQGEINVHFVHRKSSNPDAIPLLLVHGWPGSIVEFSEICKLLSQNYHVVMP